MKTEILYEDKEILVCYKPAGIATQTGGFMQTDVVSELKNYLASGKSGEPFVGVVQRLDQPVEGVLVFGKTPKATAALNKQLGNGTLKKEYLAAVFSEKDLYPAETENTLKDYLAKNKKTNMSEVVSSNHKDGKMAELTYTVLKKEKIEPGTILLVKVKLHTGRHHQIRVQMSHIGLPLLGDKKYGTDKSKQISEALLIRDVALCSRALSFLHPKSGKKMTFSVKPQKHILQKLTE